MPLEIDSVSNSSTFLDDSGCSLFSQISQSSSEEITAAGAGNKTFDLKEDKSFFAIERENAKLKFEIERMLQSEKWYKAQYKKYKISKLDILEKYYLSEKNVSIKIKLLKDENAKLKEELLRSRKKPSGCDYNCKAFQQIKSTCDCRKMQRTIDELQSVNEILRKQKDQLLTESNKITSKKDSRTLVLADLTRQNKILIENLEKSNFEIDLLKIEIRRLKFERRIDLDLILKLKKSWLEFQKKMGQEVIDTKHSKIQLLKMLLEHQNRSIHKTSEEELLVQQLETKLEIIQKSAMSQLSSKNFVIENQAMELSHLKNNIKVFQKHNVLLEESIEKQKHLQIKYENFLHEIGNKKTSGCKNPENNTTDIPIDYDEKRQYSKKKSVSYLEIQHLINRSDNYVPKFKELESSILNLKDVLNSSVLNYPGQKVSSLLEEMQQAEN